jgi:ferredoxin-NADP reductase
VCTVLHGRVDLGPYQNAALTDAMRARGQALMCCAVALEDLELEVDVPTLGASAAPKRWHGRIESLERIAQDVMRVRIALGAGERIAFVAGQYINVVLADGQRRAFSFANPPHDNALIELHVRRIPSGLYTTQVFTTMKPGDPIDFEGPLGRFTLRESERPILFVAGATGFAPIKSIVEDAFHRGIRRPMQLYWGVREAKDLYALEMAERWQREHPNCRAQRSMARPARPGARSDARRPPGPHRLRGLCLRLGADGPGGGAGVHCAGAGRTVLPVRCVRAGEIDADGMSPVSPGNAPR